MEDIYFQDRNYSNYQFKFYIYRNDNTAKMWDANAGTMDSSLNRKVVNAPLVNFSGVHSAGINSILYVNGYLFTGSADNSIVQWDMTGAAVHKYIGHSGSVNSLASSALNLYSGSTDGKIRKWTISLPYPIDFGNSGHIVISMINDAGFLYSGAYDGFVTKWDKTMSIPITSYKAHFSSITAVFSDATYLYTASYDRTIKIWRKAFLDPFVQARALVRIIRGPKDAIRSIYVTNNDIYAGCFDYRVYKFSVKTGALTATYPLLPGKVYQIRMDSNNQLFAALTDNSIVQIDTVSKAIVASYQGHTQTVNSILLNGKYLYSGSWDGTAKMWDTTSGTMKQGIRVATNLDVLTNFTGAHTDFIKDLAFKDGYLYTASMDKTIAQWDTMGNLVSKYIGHTDGVMAILMDGNTLYSGSYDYRIKKWQTYSPPLTDVSIPSDYSISMMVTIKSVSTAPYSLLTTPNLNISIPSGSATPRIYYQTSNGIYYYDNAALTLNTATNVSLLAIGSQFFVLYNDQETTVSFMAESPVYNPEELDVNPLSALSTYHDPFHPFNKGNENGIYYRRPSDVSDLHYQKQEELVIFGSSKRQKSIPNESVIQAFSSSDIILQGYSNEFQEPTTPYSPVIATNVRKESLVLQSDARRPSKSIQRLYKRFKYLSK